MKFTTPLTAAEIIDYLRVYLSKKLALRIIMHGVFMDVLGVGVLITGESGLGKSELGLELITRNHGLVADDAVEFARIAPNEFAISSSFSRCAVSTTGTTGTLWHRLNREESL